MLKETRTGRGKQLIMSPFQVIEEFERRKREIEKLQEEVGIY